MGSDVMATIGVSPSETTASGASAETFAEPPAATPGEEPDLVVTPAQRAFLDALMESGVKPSSELSALNIGSCVCQARAAKQSDQVVWDFVLPMVRGDVRDSYGESVAAPAGQVNAATADYIRIATDTLC
ncbi:DUF732 domain-containing protein [Mycolicibacterium sp.]|uniref:DUF732 domain-containing protein n=1 Tax=Mycolicibacterium sp. TaxID=2320850 RepID=UPI0025F5ABBE|nr:DUF732 domain-containing protein [Mycolicibacterium sp.]